MIATYYRLVNLKTGKPMSLSNNSNNIEDVREDILLYLSIEQDIFTLGNGSLDEILAAANLKLESSHKPFELDTPISEYLVSDVTNKEVYKPVGRIAHVSNYFH